MLAIAITQLLALSLVSPVQADEVSCWAPDGKTRGDNETYVPCNKLGIQSQGVFSSCCALDGDPDKRDVCTVNGLCQRNGVLSRGYCTDKNWDSDACVNVCIDDKSGGSSNETARITDCADGTYCCGEDNLSCCGTDSAFKLPTLAGEEPTSVTQTAVVTETSTPSTFKNATIGLAVVLGVGALVAIGAILYLLKKNKSLYAQLHEHSEAPPTVQDTPMTQATQPYHDGYMGEGTTAASTPHLQQAQYAQYKPTYSNTPHSPGMSEVEGTQRYSELDGGISVNRDSTQPPYSPMHSPRLDE